MRKLKTIILLSAILSLNACGFLEPSAGKIKGDMNKVYAKNKKSTKVVGVEITDKDKNDDILRYYVTIEYKHLDRLFEKEDTKQESTVVFYNKEGLIWKIDRGSVR